MIFKRSLARVAATIAAVAFAGGLAMSSASAADQVKARFSWKLKGEYAFFYLGQERDLYGKKQIGLSLGEGAGAQAALGAVLQGQEDVAILPGIFAISAIQKGMPVKLIALYQPAAPVVIISHPENPVTKPGELEGKTIAHAVGETGTSYLSVLCAKNNVDCGKLSKVQMDSQSRVPQFLQKKIDLVSVYLTNDLPLLVERTGVDYPVLDLAQFGLEVPGLAIVASEEGIRKRGDVLRRFLAATNEAIEATRADPAAAVTALKAAWAGSPSDKVLEKQIVETSRSIPAQGEKPLGWISEQAIENALALLATEPDFGKPRPTAAFYTNDLLSE